MKIYKCSECEHQKPCELKVDDHVYIENGRCLITGEEGAADWMWQKDKELKE